MPSPLEMYHSTHKWDGSAQVDSSHHNNRTRGSPVINEKQQRQQIMGNSQGGVSRERLVKKKSPALKTWGDKEKRRNFLERNRQAALKCRQRKKKWLQELQAKVEYLTTDNEQLHIQASVLREEADTLKRVLMDHKSCLINPAGAPVAMNRPFQTVPPALSNSQYGSINTVPMYDQYAYHF